MENGPLIKIENIPQNAGEKKENYDDCRMQDELH